MFLTQFGLKIADPIHLQLVHGKIVFNLQITGTQSNLSVALV